MDKVKIRCFIWNLKKVKQLKIDPDSILPTKNQENFSEFCTYFNILKKLPDIWNWVHMKEFWRTFSAGYLSQNIFKKFF